MKNRIVIKQRNITLERACVMAFLPSTPVRQYHHVNGTDRLSLLFHIKRHLHPERVIAYDRPDRVHLFQTMQQFPHLLWEAIERNRTYMNENEMGVGMGVGPYMVGGPEIGLAADTFRRLQKKGVTMYEFREFQERIRFIEWKSIDEPVQATAHDLVYHVKDRRDEIDVIDRRDEIIEQAHLGHVIYLVNSNVPIGNYVPCGKRYLCNI